MIELVSDIEEYEADAAKLYLYLLSIYYTRYTLLR